MPSENNAVQQLREVSFTEAINEAIREEMQRDESIFYIGEDVGYYGVTKDLIRIFGTERIRRTPISESAIIGSAVGAALTGLRPIAEIMYVDFVTTAMDQIVNQAAKLTYMSGGRVRLPMVVRAPSGAGNREAAQHSQSLEAWFVHSPGLKVVMPSTAYDAKGLMKTAIRDDNPVIYLDHKFLHRMKEKMPLGEWTVPLGKAEVKKHGDDVTVIALSYTVHEALAAARELDGEISVEVVDPRTLVPLDIDAITASVRKTGRVIVVHDACTRGGVGAEIVRRVVEEAFDYLDAPPLVLGSANTPVPYSPPLEDASIPRKDQIRDALRSIVG